MRSTHKPCDNCPWRVDAPRGYWHPDHFKDIWKTCQDDGLLFMLCHKSKPKKGIQIPCAGYVIIVGRESIGLRIAAILGRVDLKDYSSDEPLFQSFKEMLEANGVKVPLRNRWTDRCP